MCAYVIEAEQVHPVTEGQGSGTDGDDIEGEAVVVVLVPLEAWKHGKR